MLTLQAILVPITASRTSNLLRAIATLFGVEIAQSRYYTFMASVKLPWDAGLGDAVAGDPRSADRRAPAAGPGRFASTPRPGARCLAARPPSTTPPRPTRAGIPWAQTIVTVGLLKVIHGRWSCLPLAFAFYLRRLTLARQLHSRARRGRASFRPSWPRRSR